MRSPDAVCGARTRDAELGSEVPAPGSEVQQLGCGARTQGSATWTRGLGAWVGPGGMREALTITSIEGNLALT